MASVRHLGLFPVEVFAGPCIIRDEKDLVGGDNTKTGDGTNRPLGLSLQALLALYWRVKSWKIVHTHVNKEEIVPASFGADTQPNDELGLICGFVSPEDSSAVATVTQSMNSYQESEEQSSYSSGIFEIFNYGSLGPYVLKKNNVYYPNLKIAWETEDINVPPNQGDYKKQSSSIKEENDTEYGEQSIVLLGETYKIPLYGQEVVEQVDGAEFFYSGEISVNEYWEYDPGDGLGPIYDKTTGRQIRAFPSD